MVKDKGYVKKKDLRKALLATLIVFGVWLYVGLNTYYSFKFSFALDYEFHTLPAINGVMCFFAVMLGFIVLVSNWIDAIGKSYYDE